VREQVALAEASRRRYEEQARRAELAVSRIEERRRLRHELAPTVEAWERASGIREFCNAVRGRLPEMSEEDAQAAEEWLGWALLQADALDSPDDR
jgi:hypothetical protein